MEYAQKFTVPEKGACSSAWTEREVPNTSYLSFRKSWRSEKILVFEWKYLEVKGSNPFRSELLVGSGQILFQHPVCVEM